MTEPQIKTELRDHTPVLIRPVVAADMPLIKIGMDRLSAQSRYYRFLQPVPHLSDHRLKWLDQIDQINHIAWGALEISDTRQEPIGLARCIRLAEGSTDAEIAVAVVDSHQRKGLGTMLTAAVAFTASHSGISQFLATVMADNENMLEVFDELDAKRRFNSGVFEITIPLHTDADAYPQSGAGHVFRHIYALLSKATKGTPTATT
ncbi:MAG: GNAT family N-acetyltransferase [Pseudomonadota bacterium]